MIPLLEPLFQGEMRGHGASLSHAAAFPAGAVPVALLLAQPDLLAAQLRAAAASFDTRDLRPVASAWSNRYLGALLPPVVAAATLLHHRFPAHDMAVSLAPGGNVAGFHIRDLGIALPGAHAAQRYDMLLRGHLAPLFAELGRQSGLAPKIMWGNAARWLIFLFDAMQGAGDPHASAANGDRAQLIERSDCHGQENPLSMRRRRAAPRPGEQAGTDGLVALHGQCCLYHLLPGHGYCSVCPLDPARTSIAVR